MRSAIRLVLLSLVLLMVALVSAITAMRFAIHGREVAIPKLVGMTPIEADRAATASGLQLLVERRYYSPNIPEGKIMMQIPEAGTKVRRGWQVRVAQSLGPQRVAIPDVTGQTTRAAQMTIQRRGLDLGSAAKLPVAGVPSDQVLAQSPPPNASGISAPRISLLVAAPPAGVDYVMPNFVGQPLASATRVVQAAGIKVGIITVDNTDEAGPANGPAGSTTQPTVTPSISPSPESLVLSQNPPAGQKISAGTAITFEVSK